MEYKRTSGEDRDFMENCFLLDCDLERRVGKATQQNQYNQLDQIQQAMVVYCGKQPIGGGAIRKYDDEAVELKRVFVHDEWRGKGIGTELVFRLIEWAKELEYSKMILETGALLKETRAMYGRMGFRQIPNYGPYKNMPGSVCMEKLL